MRLPEGRITGFMRATLGADPGYTRLATLHSDGVMNDWPGGEAALHCIQDGRRPGSSAGENAQVFYATVTASEFGSFATATAP